MKQIKCSILSGILFGLLFGLFNAFYIDINAAFIAGPISGIMFGVAFYLICNARICKQQAQEEIKEKGKSIHSGSVGHIQDNEVVSGKLYLLTDKLMFQTQRLTAQYSKVTIDLKQIKEVRFFNTYDHIPNGLGIYMSNEKTERFIVNERRIWKSEIEKQQETNNN